MQRVGLEGARGNHHDTKKAPATVKQLKHCRSESLISIAPSVNFLLCSESGDDKPQTVLLKTPGSQMNIHGTGNAIVDGTDISALLFHVVWFCNACNVWREISLQYVVCRETERKVDRQKEMVLFTIIGDLLFYHPSLKSAFFPFELFLWWLIGTV